MYAKREANTRAVDPSGTGSGGTSTGDDDGGSPSGTTGDDWDPPCECTGTIQSVPELFCRIEFCTSLNDDMIPPALESVYEYDSVVFEPDYHLPMSQLLGVGISSPQCWANGIIPYEVDANLKADVKTELTTALNTFNTTFAGHLKFEPRDPNLNLPYVKIQRPGDANDCSAAVGTPKAGASGCSPAAGVNKASCLLR